MKSPVVIKDVLRMNFRSASCKNAFSAVLHARIVYQGVLCAQDRDAMLDHIEKRPDSNWKGSMWSFRNDAKLYGSPMFDAVWHAMTQLQHADSCREVVQQLRSAPVPWQQAPG